MTTAGWPESVVVDRRTGLRGWRVGAYLTRPRWSWGETFFDREPLYLCEDLTLRSPRPVGCFGAALASPSLTATASRWFRGLMFIWQNFSREMDSASPSDEAR